jgi:hypothetical protein
MIRNNDIVNACYEMLIVLLANSGVRNLFNKRKTRVDCIEHCESCEQTSTLVRCSLCVQAEFAFGHQRLHNQNWGKILIREAGWVII